MPGEAASTKVLAAYTVYLVDFEAARVPQPLLSAGGAFLAAIQLTAGLVQLC